MITNKLAHHIIEIKRILVEDIGAFDPQIKIGLDPETYDKLNYSIYQEQSKRNRGQFISSYTPSDIFQSQIVGVQIVPWIKEKF